MTTHTGQITKIDFRPDGSIEVEIAWAGVLGSRVFSSLTELQNVAAATAQSADEMLLAGLRWWMARNPDASNPSMILAPKTITLDYGDPVPVKVN